MPVKKWRPIHSITQLLMNYDYYYCYYYGDSTLKILTICTSVFFYCADIIRSISSIVFFRTSQSPQKSLVLLC